MVRAAGAKARHRSRPRGDDHPTAIIAPQELIDAAVTRAEAATPLGIRATSPGGLRVLNGRIYIVASYGTQDRYRAALAHELSLVDPRLKVGDVDLDSGDAPEQDQLDGLLAEAMQSQSVAGCRCTPEPIATRMGRTVWVGQAHAASCPLRVFLLNRLGPLGLTLAERPPDPEPTTYKGHLDLHNPMPPAQKFVAWDDLSEVLQGELLEAHPPDTVVGLPGSTTTKLYVRTPPADSDWYSDPDDELQEDHNAD